MDRLEQLAAWLLGTLGLVLLQLGLVLFADNQAVAQITPMGNCRDGNLCNAGCIWSTNQNKCVKNVIPPCEKQGYSCVSCTCGQITFGSCKCGLFVIAPDSSRDEAGGSGPEHAPRSLRQRPY